MSIIDEEQILSTRQKALKINLDRRIYGSFAEIGAGQEVAAFFFKAGGASGTIAKTMSAYDMTFSNAIYGEEESGRYVCEPRLNKMINKEYSLLELRLDEERGENTCFFSYSNTVVAINYQRTNQGHGWMGVKFQLNPRTEPNTAVLHVRMHEKETLAQQLAVGILGTNLIYACYFFKDEPEKFLKSLLDGLSRDRVEIDMIRIEGPDFDGKAKFDNRLLSLQLVKHGLTEATMFDPQENTLQPSEALYKKNILVLRGRFRPVTHVNMDMLRTGTEQFLKDLPEEERERTVVLTELTLHDLKAANTADIDEKDFLDRVDILCSLGQTVMISNYHEYHRLVSYLSSLTRKKIGIVMGIFNLESIFHEKYYTNLRGGILEAFSQLFMHYIKVYVYPYTRENGDIYNIQKFKLPPNQIDLFEYLIANHKIADLVDIRKDTMHIISDHVLALIKAGSDGWEDMVPQEVSKKIKENCLFGYPCDIMEKRKQADAIMQIPSDKLLQKTANRPAEVEK